MKRFFAASLLLVACAGARADPQTGHWHDPARVGVGISLHREGDTIFATVLDYDPDGRPTWLFASQVKATGTHLDPGGEVFRGPLFRGQGTPLVSQAPRTFSAVQVGHISMWQMGSILTVNLEWTPTSCPATCEPVVFGGYFVRLL